MASPMSASVIKSSLRTVSLFADLREHELDALAMATRPVAFRKGARVFEEGTSADCCYVLTSGSAKVVLDSEDGVETVVANVSPGDLVGEIALLDGFSRSAALVANAPCQFLRIPASAFEALRSNAAFERKLVARVARYTRDTNEHVRRVSSGPSISRVAWCLGKIARREGKRDGKTVVIPKKPHQELAGMAGCSRETVTRALGELKRRKYVSWDARNMRLEDGLKRYIRSELASAGAAPGRP